VTVPSSIERIAPFPPVVLELLNAIPLRQDCNLIEFIRSEPGLSREIARVALEAEKCTAEGAVDEESMIASLPPADLAKIAITIALHNYLRITFSLPEDRRYWGYTLACALCCAELAEPGKMDPLLAYAAGMLHDVGRLALIQAYPEKYANLLTLTNRMFANDQLFDLLSYERMLFGLDHFATAAWLAEAWRLPAWLRPIVGKFDERASAEHRKLVETVRTGTRLAHSLGFGFLIAAPRMEIRTIINQLPSARERWRTLDAWNLAEQHLRAKIQTRLRWYAVLSHNGQEP
jgi:hypothetical protein